MTDNKETEKGTPRTTEMKEGVEEESEETVKEESASNLLENLIILPPKLKDEEDNEDEEDSHILCLPPLRLEEPVSSIRAALSEVRGYAHFTQYRLVLEPPSSPSPPTEDNGTSPKTAAKKPAKKSTSAMKKKALEEYTVSPYTLSNARILTPSTTATSPEEIVLDDFGDLTPYATYFEEGYCRIRIVLERYDAAAVKDHVMRIRSLLDGNPPFVVSLVDDGAQQKEEEGKEKDGNVVSIVYCCL